jgi:putative ABC transport system permease protein
LFSISGTRFQNEKKFKAVLKEILTPAEATKYLPVITATAQSFREGSALTLTFIDSAGYQVGARFRIAGIYDVNNAIFESTVVFVRNSDMSRLAGFGTETYNQLIVRLDEVGETEKYTALLKQAWPDYEILNWKDLQPDLAMMTDYVYQMYGIFMAIILAALAFGIVNTMLMAVLERTKELGMLAAIGMNRRRIFSMIMLESVFLSVTGGITGMITAMAIVKLTAREGINLAVYAEGMEAFGYSAHIFPEISGGFLIMGSILIIITGILSSIYPALKALRLNPVEALRTE